RRPWLCGMMLQFQFNDRVALSSCNRQEKKKRSIRALLEPEPRVPGMSVHQYDVKHRAFGAFESRSRGRNKRAAQE
ncbi:hypothetical protein ACR6FN_034005, partial [Pseudomonas aeruginosa]